MTALSKWVNTWHGSEYKRAREMPRLKETLGEHLLQPPALKSGQVFQALPSQFSHFLKSVP